MSSQLPALGTGTHREILFPHPGHVRAARQRARPRSRRAATTVSTFVSLHVFLEEALFGRRDIVLPYDRGGGITFANPDMQADFRRALSGYDCFHGTNYSQGLPRNPDGVLNCSKATCACGLWTTVRDRPDHRFRRNHRARRRLSSHGRGGPQRARHPQALGAESAFLRSPTSPSA